MNPKIDSTLLTQYPAGVTPLMESAPDAETIIDGRKYLYFAGTSYMGLHAHPEVISAGCAAFQQYGLHSATTRSGFGNTPPLLSVERAAACFFNCEDAFYFSSGYVANHILIQTISHRTGTVFVDESAHYCVLEAAQLAGKPVVKFQPRNPQDLSKKIRHHLTPGTSPLVMIDGIVPSTGILAPIEEYVTILQEFPGAILMLDDAHGFGVLGENGRGTLEHFGLWECANGGSGKNGISFYACGTLGKALGGFGGILPGTTEFVSLARRSSHYYDGASAPPAPVSGASAKSLELIQNNPLFRSRLQANNRQLQSGLRKLGIDVPESPAAQTGVVIGDRANMLRLHTALRNAGFIVPAVGAYPGIGPEGVMRFAVSSSHTPQMIADLLEVLSRLL